MTRADGLVVVLGVCVGLMVIVRDWRTAWLLLLGVALASVALLADAVAQAGALVSEAGVRMLMAIDLATAASVTLILLVTGLSYSRDLNVENLDEFGLTELRRVARRATRFTRPTDWSDYLLPTLAVALLLVATALAPNLYPYQVREVDYAWTCLILGGILAIVIADTLLRVGLGLLLLALGLKLFYVGIVPRAGLVELALLNLLTIGVALVVAYLSALLYGRLKTLDLETMYRE